MKYILPVFIFLIVIPCISYSRTNRNGGPATGSGDYRTDTFIICDQKVFPFGDDSVYCYSEYEYTADLKVVYTQFIPDGEVHYRIFDETGKLKEIAYALSRVAIENSEPDRFSRFDSVIRYHGNGGIAKTGCVEYTEEKDYRYACRQIWGTYYEFDTTGMLTYKIIPTVAGHIGFSYHPNGAVKSRWEQGNIYASGALLEDMEWDSLGNKIKETTYSYFFPEWGTSYNSRLGVATMKEYYPAGKIRRITHHKSFVESEEYPCGCWDYFDSLGEKVRSEQYPPCDNFELEY
ncbi:MAG: hypothetical protein LUG18_07165 [Candidatus Azobacteroides sp.]|nr:hypothetical protein [Candidatus Azobacteroides sp.]